MAGLPPVQNTTDRIEPARDGRLISPSALRNSGPIIEALHRFLNDCKGLMLEIGSGTGQHAAAWAQAFPQMDWQPSDPFEVHLDSIRAWAGHACCLNLRPPIWLDAADPWPKFEPLAGVISVNVIHIAPWVVTKGLIAGAGNAVAPGGLLIFYGPFKEAGEHTGEGNARFDATLQAEDPAWGIRDLDEIAALATQASFGPPDVIKMPANNRLVVFSRLA